MTETLPPPPPPRRVVAPARPFEAPLTDLDRFVALGIALSRGLAVVAAYAEETEPVAFARLRLRGCERRMAALTARIDALADLLASS